MDLFWEMKRPSSTKDKRETVMFRVFNHFSKIYIREER